METRNNECQNYFRSSIQCGKDVGRNSIQCEGCTKLIHKKCSGMKGKEDPGYRCAKCVRGGCAEGGGEEQEVVL